MPISTPVPQEYAKQFDAKTPSTYDQYVAFTGPYMYKNDSSGKLVGRKPGQAASSWCATPTGIRRPTTAPPTWTRSRSRRATTTRSPRRGGSSRARRLVQGDGTTPAPVIKQALSRNKDQIAFIPGGGYRMIAMNSTIKPFDNLNVRKAVRGRVRPQGAAAHARRHGGRRPGDALPAAGFPGFDDAGGAKGTGADFLANPRGDMALAKKYMLAAKKQDPSLPIDASGMWTGTNKLLMVASNADPGKKTGEVAQAQFEKVGIQIKFRTAPQDTLYTKYCNVPKAQVVICPNVGFFKDFNDPQSLLDPVFNGKNILPAEQLQLVAAQRPRHQQRDGEGGGAAGRPRA